MSAEQVEEHFERWGLKNETNWCQDGKIPEVNESSMTRRDVHSNVGELAAHFPVCGRVRIMCSMLQRLTTENKTDWNENVREDVIEKLGLYIT